VESTVLGGVAAGTRRDTEGSLKKSHMHLFSNSQCLYFILGLGRATYSVILKARFLFIPPFFVLVMFSPPHAMGFRRLACLFFFYGRRFAWFR
jgi:hypothetical protein